MDLFGFDPPDLDDREVARIARDTYGLGGRRQRLRGERSHNTLITSDDGPPVVLKVASASDPIDTIEFHAAALVHLESVAPELPLARMVPALDGRMVPSIERDGLVHAMRMVTFLPGATFDDGQAISDDGLRAIGELVGSLSAALADFDHSAAHQIMPWDIGNGLLLDDELWSLLGDDARALLEPARPRLARILDTIRDLPHQVIHNDAHAGNLLRADATSDLVTGVIDFGDLVHTATVADLGVSGANLVPHQADPPAAMGALVRGFHGRRPLTRAEIEVLPELVLGRLALTALFTDYQTRKAPHIAALVADERPRVLAGVERWLALEPDRVRLAIEAALR